LHDDDLQNSLPEAAVVGATTGRPGPHERDEIERFLAEIAEALYLPEEADPASVEITTNEPHHALLERRGGSQIPLLVSNS